MNFCPNCGAKIAPNAKFCTSCGQPLAEPTKSTNNESAEEDIYSTDENEDDILEEETNEIEDNEEKDYENDKDDKEYNDDEAKDDDEEEIPPISPTDKAIIDYIKTRKDYASSDTKRVVIALIVAFLLTLLCIAILLGVIVGLVGGLWAIGEEFIGGSWGKVIIGICKAVLALAFVCFIPGIIYLYRFFKSLYGIIYYFLIRLFCLIYIRKHKKEICSDLSISNEDIRDFYKDRENIDALIDYEETNNN